MFNAKLLKLSVFASVLCVMQIMMRMYYSSNLMYLFLVWNLFLAWIPYAITIAIQEHPFVLKNKFLLFGALMAWLVFFPNGPYILTDLFHLHLRPDVPKWFDLILLLSFGWTGLMLGLISLYNVQNILSNVVNKFFSRAVVVGAAFLSGYGVYLGRFERYNSWNLLTDPILLIKDILGHVLHPIQHKDMVVFSFSFGLFVLLVYYTLIIFTETKKNEG